MSLQGDFCISPHSVLPSTVSVGALTLLFSHSNSILLVHLSFHWDIFSAVFDTQDFILYGKISQFYFRTQNLIYNVIVSVSWSASLKQSLSCSFCFTLFSLGLYLGRKWITLQSDFQRGAPHTYCFISIRDVPIVSTWTLFLSLSISLIYYVSLSDL